MRRARSADLRGIVLSAGAIRGFPDPGVLCRLLATSPFAGFLVFASPGIFAARPPAHLVALPGQLVFETSSGCGPVKAAAAIGLPRRWYSSQAVA
jgi:hypothetical protein